MGLGRHCLNLTTWYYLLTCVLNPYPSWEHLVVWTRPTRHTLFFGIELLSKTIFVPYPFGGSIGISWWYPLAMTHEKMPSPTESWMVMVQIGLSTTKLDAKLCQVVVKPPAFFWRKLSSQPIHNYTNFGQNWSAQKWSVTKFYSMSVICLFLA